MNIKRSFPLRRWRTLRGETVGLSEGCDENLERYIKAAIIAHDLGLRSIDHVMRRYGHYLDNVTIPVPSEADKLTDEICSFAASAFLEINERRAALNDLPDLLGLFAAGAALLRCESSFRTADLLIREGLFVEAACISKLLVEQIAWAHMVSPMISDDVFDTSTTKAISHFRKIYPTVGRIYERLNKVAHLDPRMTHRILTFPERGPHVLLWDRSAGPDGALNLLYVADMYGVAMELIYHSYFGSLKYVKKSVSGLVIDDRRATRATIVTMTKRVVGYEKCKAKKA